MYARKSVLFVVLVLVLLLAVTGVASAAPPSGWITLRGNVAGSMSYVEISYPGGKADLNIEVYWSPFDPAYCQQLGFNVYGPYEWEGRGVQQEGCFHRLSYRNEDPALLVVQVYNYSKETVRYRMEVEGVSESRCQFVTEGASALSEHEKLAQTAQGTLVGNEGGAFAHYGIYHPGNDEDMTVTMNYEPADPSFKGAFGFDIFELNGDHVASGVATEPLGVLEATFASEEEATYCLQVHNYTDGAILTYSLTMTQ